MRRASANPRIHTGEDVTAAPVLSNAVTSASSGAWWRCGSCMAWYSADLPHVCAPTSSYSYSVIVGGFGPSATTVFPDDLHARVRSIQESLSAIEELLHVVCTSLGVAPPRTPPPPGSDEEDDGEEEEDPSPPTSPEEEEPKDEEDEDEEEEPSASPPPLRSAKEEERR